MVRFLLQKKCMAKTCDWVSHKKQHCQINFFLFLNFPGNLWGVYDIVVVQSRFLLHRLKVLFPLIILFNSKSIRSIETFLLHTNKENMPHPLLKTQKYCMDAKYCRKNISCIASRPLQQDNFHWSLLPFYLARHFRLSDTTAPFPLKRGQKNMSLSQ